MFAKYPRGLAVLGGGGELASTRGFRTCPPRLEDSDAGEAGGSGRGSSFGRALGRGRDSHGGGPRGRGRPPPGGRGGPPPGGRGGPSLGWRGGPPPGGRVGTPPHGRSGPPRRGPSQWDGPSDSQSSKAGPPGGMTDGVSSDAILGLQMGRSGESSFPRGGPPPGGRGGAPAVGGDYGQGPRGRGRPPLGGDRGRPQLDERVTNRGPVSGERRDRGRGGSFPGREQGEGEPGFVGGEERRGRADIAGRGATSRESTERSHGKTETPRQRSAARKSAAAGNPEEYVGSEVDPAELFESDLEEFAAEGDVPDEQIEPDVDLSALFGDMEDQQPKGLKHAKPFRRDPDNLRPQMLYKEERELKHRREEKLGETLRRQERMDNKRDQRHDRKPRQLDPARARQIQRVLADNEGKEIHYNELMKYGRQAPEVFTPVMEDIEAVIPGLPEAHWMRSYLKTSIAAVKNNEQLTQKDRTRFVCNIVRTLQAINEKLKQNKESDSGAAGSQ